MLGEDDSPDSSVPAGHREQPDGEVAVAQPSWEWSFRWSLLCVNATCHLSRARVSPGTAGGTARGCSGLVAVGRAHKGVQVATTSREKALDIC